MPSYDVNIPGQGKYRVNSPTDLTEDQVWSALQGQLSVQPAPPAQGVGAALTGGLKRYGSELETALESIINPQLAAERGLEREKKLSEQYAPGASLERVKQKYEQEGLFPAAKEAVGQIPGALAEQFPNMATAIGGARLGAMAGSAVAPGIGTLIGGGLGAAASALPQLYAANLQRQAGEGKPVERLTALGAAVPAAALEVVSEYIPLGRGVVGKLLGPAAEKALAKGSNEAIERAAKESLLGSVTKGAGVGLLAEIPTEVAQQMLERLQAGLPLTTPDALAEYGEAAYGAGLVGGPFGAVGRVAGRPQAQADYAKLLQQQELENAPPVTEEVPTNITPMPAGYSVEREEIGRTAMPQTFNITMPGAPTPLASVDTEEEAQQKLAKLTEIREQEREKSLNQIQEINDDVQKKKDKLDHMEATEQTGTEEYKQLKANLPAYMETAAQKSAELHDKIETYGKPLEIVPEGQKEQVQEQYKVLNKAGQPVQAFKTLGEAEAHVRELVGEKPFKAAQERTEAIKTLESQLLPAMQKFGLKNVALKVVDNIENNAGGAYFNKLMRVAVDEAYPMRTMRHESVHALKDLGFFTPQQWKALEQHAEREWIKTHLEGQQTEIDGKPMSRLEGYEKMGLSRDAIVEEAIADAFAAYDKGEVPPPGLVAQLFKRLKQFFANLKQAMSGAGFESAEDIFQRIERGELKPSLKGAESAKTGEIKYAKKPVTVQETIDDGVKRLVESARKHRLNTLEERYMVGLARADTALTKIQDGIEKRLLDLGVSNELDARGSREINDIIYDKVLPAVRSQLKAPKYSLAGAGVPLSTRNIMEMQTPVAQQDLGLNTVAVRNRFNNVREIAKALNQYTKTHAGTMNPKDLSPQESTKISEAIADEVAYQLGTQAKTGTGLGWYSNNYPNAVKKLAKRFPELGTSKHARSVFSALVAVTSNGEKVTKNIDNAIKLYEDLRQGKPLVAMSNRRATALENNLVQIQDLLKLHKKNFEKVLLQEITVKEMNEALRAKGEKADGSYLANTVVPAAAVYFGPKLGAFYANLSGSEGYLTMDLWWTRSINRMRGVLMPSATNASIEKFRNMMDMPKASREKVISATIPLRNKYEEYGYNTELEHMVGSKEPSKKDLKPEWFKHAEEKAGDAYEQMLFEHNLEKMANTIYKNEFEMLEEAPFSASDRKFMYDAARKAQGLLRKEGIDLSLADIQAALWYYEKRLYAKLSGKKADDIGYEEAIIAQADKAGGRAGSNVGVAEQLDGGAEPAGKGEKAGRAGAVTDQEVKYSLRTHFPTADAAEAAAYQKAPPSTPEFKRFFGASKIEEEGRPQVMYHGSPNIIEEFNDNKPIFVTPDAEFAEQFAEDRAKDSGLDSKDLKIYPLWIRAETPFDYENLEHVDLIVNKITLDQKLFTPDAVVRLKQSSPRVSKFRQEVIEGLWSVIEDPVFQDALKSTGFDSFNVKEGGNKNLAVFNANQVKSVTGNIGEFGENKSIKFSLPSVSQGAEDAVNRVTTVRQPKGWMENILGALSPKNYDYYRQAALNRYEALARADKIRAQKMGGAALMADQSAETAALMSDLHSGVAASVFGIQGRRGGVPILRNGITTVDHSKKGLVEVLSPLSKYGDPKVYQYFQFYSAVKRGARLFAKGRERLIEPKDVQFAAELGQKFPEFEQVRKDWVTFNDAVADYQVQTGVLSRADADRFTQYSDYIPFYRQFEGVSTLGPNIFQSLSGVKKPKTLKGGKDPLADFMETIVRNTHSAITAGMKNVAEQRVIKVGKDVGIVNDIQPGTSVLEMEKITVLINGVKTEYQCTDPLFAEATRSLNTPELPFMSFLSAPANLLRNVVTREPGFIMTNLLRDSMSAYVTSGANITPITGTIINFGKAMKGMSPEFEALMDAGIIGGYEFSANIEQSGERLTADLMKKAGKGNVLLKPFTSLWDGLEKATTASDAATRMAVYERVLAETGNEAEALSRALEVMNFNRKGSSAVVRILTAAVPFLNARMQGLDLFYRAMTGKMNNVDAKEVQRKFFTRGMMIMGLSTMYYFAVAGDPEYEKQEQETKDGNWIVPSAGIRIPIPFEVGILFKTIPERIAAYTFGNDTGKDFLDAMSRAANGFIPISPAAYIPQTFKPIIEAMTNYSFFTQREIVGMGLKDVAPEYQVGPGTSAFAQFVGKTLGLSPIKVDHVFKGYTGTMGMYAVDVMDSVMDLSSDSPKPTKRFEQLPIIKRLVMDPEARGNVTNYYQLKDSVDTAVRTMNLLEKSGDPKEYAEYVKQNAGTLAVRSYVGDLEKSMKELRDMRKQVQNSPMSGDQKRDVITAIGRAENNLSQNIQTVKKAIDNVKV